MAMRKRYVINPKLLESDIEMVRFRIELARQERAEGLDPRKVRARGDNPRKKTRMIGKRELLTNDIRTGIQLGTYLSLPKNKERRVSGKTFHKVSQPRNRK